MLRRDNFWRKIDSFSALVLFGNFGRSSYVLITVPLFLRRHISVNNRYVEWTTHISSWNFLLAGWFSVNPTEENKEKPFGNKLWGTFVSILCLNYILEHGNCVGLINATVNFSKSRLASVSLNEKPEEEIFST